MPPKKVKSDTEVDATSTTKRGGVKKSTGTKAPSLDTNIFQVNNIKLMKVFEKLTKTVENVQKVQEEFNANFENLQNYTDEELNDMDYQLRLKNEECYNHLQELTKQYNEKQFTLESDFEKKKYELETTHQRRIDELEHKYEEKEYELAKGVITSSGDVIISSAEQERLTSRIKEFEDGRENFEKSTTADMHKELNARLKTQELQHQVDTSNMKAKIENQEREITSLRETIVSLRDEIQAQRELTREVANAGQKSVTQNFGK